ncbi:WYL domain-containing protein [Parapedobacter tibetensis]|uniref:WYL domain-containing protein n=1 Tax=Parapedobacter tibetensis TaxID=2972951 RepID=UPI0027E4EFE5|nr:WYL domain-containing protein [Parapedobacter tibetensis]
MSGYIATSRWAALVFTARHAPYVLTKPLHASLKLLKQDETGAIIRICVVLNFELERELLGFGEAMKVLSPRDLQKRISTRAAQTAALYHEMA